MTTTAFPLVLAAFFVNTVNAQFAPPFPFLSQQQPQSPFSQQQQQYLQRPYSGYGDSGLYPQQYFGSFSPYNSQQQQYQQRPFDQQPYSQQFGSQFQPSSYSQQQFGGQQRPQYGRGYGWQSQQHTFWPQQQYGQKQQYGRSQLLCGVQQPFGGQFYGQQSAYGELSGSPVLPFGNNGQLFGQSSFGQHGNNNNNGLPATSTTQSNDAGQASSIISAVKKH